MEALVWHFDMHDHAEMRLRATFTEHSVVHYIWILNICMLAPGTRGLDFHKS